MASATITGSGSLVFTATADVMTAAGAELTLDFAGDVTIQSGASVHANVFPLSARNVTIESGALLSASALGSLGVFNAAGGGPSGGLWGVWGGTGGGHGGHGSGTATTHGIAATPDTYGSAGGGTANDAGANGGGRIKIVATQAVTIDGTLTADGEDGVNAPYMPTGAGAGGSIWIDAGTTLAGSGTVSANGGAGVINQTNWSGGAGGGRIALEYATSTLAQTPSVAPGVNGNGGTAATAGSVCTDDGMGTVCN
jgi:hypothetical protein